LRSLDVSNNKLSQEILQLLFAALATEELPLISLNLSNTGIIDAQMLVEVLEKNRMLNTLDLKGNKITEIDAQVIAKALVNNSHMTTLDLTGNPNISPATLANITALCQRNQQALVAAKENTQTHAEKSSGTELYSYKRQREESDDAPFLPVQSSSSSPVCSPKARR
jgi:hypothetical protein